jgi:hypothetical protein
VLGSFDAVDEFPDVAIVALDRESEAELLEIEFFEILVSV